MRTKQPTKKREPQTSGPVGRGRSRNARWRMLAVALAAGLAGCSAPARVGRENDRLRHDNLELRRQVEQLEDAIKLRLAQIDGLEQRAGKSARVDGAELVQLTALRFGRYSGALDTDHNGTDDVLRVYLQPVDQHGRFMLAAGRAQLQAVSIVPDQEPRLILEHAGDAAEFDRAYRSGLTGTHYTLERPLPAPLPADVTGLTVVVAFTDAATGAQLRHEQAYHVQPTAPAFESE